MVKKSSLIFSICISFLLTASLALADNIADVNTEGTDNIAVIEQTGAGSDSNDATINQGQGAPPANDNFATIQQIDASGKDSEDNLAVINQEGGFSNAAIIQNTDAEDAKDNNALINQTGTGGVLDDPNSALIVQTGTEDNNNLGVDPVTITQTGLGNQAQITQTGDNNENTIITQDGENNQALLTQGGLANGLRNDGLIDQLGNLNVAILSQDGDDNEAEINQNGDGNQARIGQTGDDNFVATVDQTASDFATAVILQTTDGSATITQAGTAVNLNDGNQAYVSQDGFQTATVDQVGAGNQALVLQGVSPADPFGPGAIPINPVFDALPPVPAFPVFP